MRSTFLLLLAPVALALPAWAQEGGVPRLGDHEFVPTMAITEPFLTTHVQTEIALGTTVNSTTTLTDPQDSTTVGTIDADQLLTSIGFRYQQGIQDWLVTTVNLGFSGRLGTDTSTLVADGITGALAYEFGWMMRIARSESTLLSGSLSLGNSSATFITPFDWVYALINGQEAQLTYFRRSLTGSGGLHGAWGLDRRFGLIGSLRASYGESFDRVGDNHWLSDARLALSYDLATDLDIPLGLALTAGRFEHDANANRETGTWFWNLRLALKGRSDFTIGLQTGMSFFNLENQDSEFQLFQAGFDMRYYY